MDSVVVYILDVIHIDCNKINGLRKLASALETSHNFKPEGMGILSRIFLAEEEES
jgi:hypothetical protein